MGQHVASFAGGGAREQLEACDGIRRSGGGDGRPPSVMLDRADDQSSPAGVIVERGNLVAGNLPAEGNRGISNPLVIIKGDKQGAMIPGGKKIRGCLRHQGSYVIGS